MTANIKSAAIVLALALFGAAVFYLLVRTDFLEGITVYDLAFYAISGVILASALGVVLFPNVVRAAFMLIVTFFGVAALYILLSADFLAAVQVIVYIGGILVMVLFAIMLTLRQGERSFITPRKSFLTLFLAGGLSLVVFGLLRKMILTAPWKVAAEAPEAAATTAPIGRLLLTQYLLPFEIVSVLLLMALIGAVVLIRKEVK